MSDCPDTHERSSCDVPHQCVDCLEGMSSLLSRRPCRFGCWTGSAIDVLICRKDICIRILPSEVETRQQSSSEMIIPVLDLLTLHFSNGHVSELNILNNRPYNIMSNAPLTPVCCRNAPRKFVWSNYSCFRTWQATLWQWSRFRAQHYV